MAATPVRTFNLRLSDDEFAKVVAKAEQLGLSRAGLIRRLLERAGILEGPPTPAKAQPAAPAPSLQRLANTNFKKAKA
jgi:hypothetical protein